MAKRTVGMIDISKLPDPELQADWIKTPENRASEREAHRVNAEDTEEFDRVTAPPSAGENEEESGE